VESSSNANNQISLFQSDPKQIGFESTQEQPMKMIPGKPTYHQQCGSQDNSPAQQKLFDPSETIDKEDHGLKVPTTDL